MRLDSLRSLEEGPTIVPRNADGDWQSPWRGTGIRLLFGFLPFTCLVACGPSSTEYRDNGVACVAQDAADPEAEVFVFSNCHTGSAYNVEHSCSVRVDGDRLVVHSTTSYDTPHETTDDCEFEQTHCTVTAPAGDYLLVFGEEELEVTLPNDIELPSSPSSVPTPP